MISKQIALIDYMTCECGNHPRLMRTNQYGVPKFHVEAYCCGTITVKLSKQRAAINEFQRIRATQEIDKARHGDTVNGASVLKRAAG